MQALVFLTVRSLINGIRRAVSSGRRIIGLIFFIVYWLSAVVRPFDRSSNMPLSGIQAPLNMPHNNVLDAIVFGIFAFLSFMLVLNVMGYKGGFRRADVDVMFATPISPKVVLVFRLARDYMFTLLMPALFALIGWRAVTPGVSALIRNFPTHGRYVFSAMTVAWFLMALCWVCMGYAASLFINRSDLESDRNKKIIAGSIGVILVATGVYIGLTMKAAIASSPDAILPAARDLALSPWLRSVFFTATAATALVMAPITGNFVQGAVGFVALVGIIVVSMRIAMTQVEWLYDQAAAKGFDAIDMRAMQRRGDYYGVMANQARQGKLRPGRLAARISKVRVRGSAAMLWKDLIMQARGALWQWVLFGLLALFIVDGPLYAMQGESGDGSVAMLFTMLAVSTFVTSMGANAGVIEMLQRVDFQKPLPFSPSTIIIWEVIGKAMLPVAMSVLSCLTAMIIRPDLALSALAAMICLPSLAILLVSVNYLVTVLFPDFEDPTQRGFRSAMMLLGLALMSFPSVGLFLVLFMFHVPPLVIAIPFIIVNLAIAAGASAISGSLYSTYNPSE